jgi:hypothetical protein
MKKLHLLLGLFILLVSMVSAKPVLYLQDSIAEKNNETVRLLGGSVWKLVSPSLMLVADDVLVVFHPITDKQGKKDVMPVYYASGEEVPALYISGNIKPFLQNGYLTTIMAKNSSGSKLQTAEGYILHISSYDQYDTGWWLPPYQVLITNDQMYMWNLREGKRIWIDGIYR